MNIDDYQGQAARTLIDKPDFEFSSKDLMVLWTSFGIAGETGELVDLIKKGIFHQHGVDEDNVKKEIGDIMWYIAGLCTIMNINLSEVLAHNIEKLKVRFPDGWDSERSKFREGLAK